jgi:UDP-N-acetylmuramoyl-L-alanyl-D-glutamate--2,6-diaminopimelate ligase
VLTDNTRQALALISARFYGHPSEKMKLIGITGTNGKTTTSNLAAAVLGAAGLKCGLIGTIHNRIGDRILPVTHTTPESLDLQRLLAWMLSEGADACVMEVSSHGLALHRVDGCVFETVVFTNCTQDHFDFHKDMEDYLAAKLQLFVSSESGANKGAKYAVVNADDDHAASFIKASSGTVYTYGVYSPADARAEDIEVKAGGVSFTVGGKWGRCPLQLKVTGMFNVYNALAAFTAAAAMGIPVEVIKNALEDIKGVPGRLSWLTPARISR